MPGAKRGLVAPQNTFLENVIRRCNASSEPWIGNSFFGSFNLTRSGFELLVGTYVVHSTTIHTMYCVLAVKLVFHNLGFVFSYSILVFAFAFDSCSHIIPILFISFTIHLAISCFVIYAFSVQLNIHFCRFVHWVFL